MAAVTSPGPPSRSALRRKRAFDLAVCAATAPLWVPALLAGAAVTWAVSGRPILYTQVRMGRHGEPFQIMKLRTMRDGPAPAGALFAGWTYKDDPRVTPLGRVLRRYRIDELPQIYNVLRGEMSLVGPRPEPWEVAETLCRQIEGYARRHDVPPGLTGACQLSGQYLDFGTIEKSRTKLGFDLAYIDRLSIREDIRLLLRTPATLLRGLGVT
jgi:lipopolysaccharide/colanic/teichoic acid biosynthesis glycosyltransferase